MNKTQTKPVKRIFLAAYITMRPGNSFNKKFNRGSCGAHIAAMLCYLISFLIKLISILLLFVVAVQRGRIACICLLGKQAPMAYLQINLAKA